MERMNNILIVDDNKSISDVLKATIADKCDFNVFVCKDYKEARQLLETRLDFFISVLDVNLPDAPNGEVIDYVIDKDIPVIVLTGNLNDSVREKIISYPIVDYVIKENMSEIRYVVSLIERMSKNPDIKILVVDDSLSYRSYIVKLLQIHKFQVLEGTNGIEALDVLDKNKGEVTMVITDYNMEKMDGIELTKAIRRDYSRSELCIVAISSESSSNLSAKFLKAGANDTISKSFLVEEFNSRINNHLDMIEHIRQVETMAIVDQMTGLFNRRHLFNAGNKIFFEAKKNNYPLAVAILDVDFFKKVNDNYGHEVGDIVLKSIAEVMLNESKKKDIVVRFGGEEFSILVSGSANPEVFFEMLRRSVELMEIPLQDGSILKITISIGLANKLEGTLEDTLRIADRALYKAKEKGRNQIVVSSDLDIIL